jgi:predicted NBD/HSP70 family sugar kinase
MRKIDLNNFQVATSEIARDINSRIMLNLVRKHQPLSRADLMRHSGLQRSTVSVITEQLISERWLREGAVGKAPRGRRPTFLHLNEDRAGIFGINIQPHATDIALANLSGRFLAQETMLTPADPEKFVSQVSRRIRELRQEHPQMAYEELGVSLPGRVDLTSQKFVFAPNLGWGDIDLKARLESATGLSVALENAANACALSEFWFGKHAEGVRNLVVITVSEGIGTGMILNGQLVRGTSGLAGEFGHVAINENGPKCGCGNHGCWEVYASNSAAVRYYNEHNQSAAPAGRRRGGARQASAVPTVETFDVLMQLAEQGDARAIETLTRMAHYLGKGIAMLVTGLAPDVVVLVGNIARVWDRVGPQITEVVRQSSATHAATKITASGLNPQPRLRGIIALTLQKHFGAPSAA